MNPKLERALLFSNSQERLGVLERFWPKLAHKERVPAFVTAYGSSDAPMRNRKFVVRALRWFARQKVVATDDQGAAAFAEAPAVLRVFRGTCSAEGRLWPIGCSWTLDGDKAKWFATQHGRFRTRDFPPLLLEATIRKVDARAWFFDRREAEVLFVPRFNASSWKNITFSRLDV